MAIFAIPLVPPVLKALAFGLGAAATAVVGLFSRKHKSEEVPAQPQARPKKTPAAAAAKSEPKKPEKPRPASIRPVSPFAPLTYAKHRLIEWGKMLWEETKQLAIKVATFAWFWTKRAAVAVASATLDLCSRLLKRTREASAQKRLAQALNVQTKVQNLEIAGVQTFTKAPPRNKNQIPEAFAA